MKEVEVKKRKACRIAYIEHLGEYSAVPFEKYIPQLYGWAKQNKVMPGFMPMGIYHDDPEKTSAEKCRSEIAITFKGRAKPGNDIKVRNLPAMNVAVIKHKAPAKEYRETYRKLSEWIVQNGYEWAGPPIEIYTKKPKVEAGETIIYAHIQAPVRKVKSK